MEQANAFGCINFFCINFGSQFWKACRSILASNLWRRCRMDVHLAQELLNELGSSLERLETQQSALLQFLKDKGIVTDEQLAPYLSQAGNASNVRWRAAHVRLEHIFSAAEQKEQQEEERQAAEAQTRPGKDDKNKKDKDMEEVRSASKAGNRRAAKEKEQGKDEKTESAGAQPQVPANEAKANGDQAKHSPQRREEDDAA
jgi:hypothetical protein